MMMCLPTFLDCTAYKRSLNFLTLRRRAASFSGFDFLSRGGAFLLPILQRSNIAYQAKGRPVIGVRIASICTLDEGALGSSQRLHLAVSIQQMLIEALHQFAGGVIFNRPETHHQRLCSGGQEGASQSQLLVATAAQSGFTAAQRHQFASLQIEAEGVNRVESAIGQQNG